MKANLLLMGLSGLLGVLLATTAGAQGTKVTIRDDNMLLVNGEPFFPIGMYYAFGEFKPGSDEGLRWQGVYYAFEEFKQGSDEGLRRLKELGINTVFPGYWNEERTNADMDRAHALGLKVWIRAVLGSSTAESLRKVADLSKNHPALLLWETDDEPLWSGGSLEGFLRAYQAMKQIDPDHPIWMNQAPRNSFGALSAWAEACDIYGCDIYPVPEGCGHSDLANQQISSVGDYTDRFKAAAGGKKPVIMVLQAFSWPNGEGKPCPTEKESRFMAYQAIVHGANGLMYFNPPGWGTSAGLQEMWRGLEKVLGELTLLQNCLIARASSKTITAIHAETGPSFERGIETLVKEVGSEYAIIAVNADKNVSSPSAPGARVTFRAPWLRDGQLVVLFEGRTVEVADGEFQDEFEGFAVHVYATSESVLASAPK